MALKVVKKGPRGFSLDRDRLEQLCRLAHDSWSDKIRKYLPQWNLPKELEHSPIRDETKDPESAAKYLWTAVFFERLTRSSAIIRNSLNAWYNPEKNWVFSPHEVKRRSEADIEEVLSNDFQFGLKGRNEAPPAERFFYNAERLVEVYDGDPRNLIRYNTVDQARSNLKGFKGIGTGIANLFIIYLMERGIVSPTDAHNALLKVDVHKGRIPVNCEAVVPLGTEVPRDDFYVRRMEGEYHRTREEGGMDAIKLDAALWVIGSEHCMVRDYGHCAMACPLFGMCKGMVPEDKDTGRYIVKTPEGARIDTRKNKDQKVLFS